MSFFFRRKAIVVDAFTYIETVIESNPIEIAAKFIPEWWRRMDKCYFTDREWIKNIPEPTMKTCPGFLDLYKRGLIVPLWKDIELETKEDGGYSYVTTFGEDTIQSHNSNQYGNQFQDSIHFKFLSPWFFSEKTGVQFYFGNPFWSHVGETVNTAATPAIATPGAKGMVVNVNAFYPRQNKRYSLKAGLPMLHIIPLTEKNLIVKTHLISRSEFVEKEIQDSCKSSFIKDAINRKRSLCQRDKPKKFLFFR